MKRLSVAFCMLLVACTAANAVTVGQPAPAFSLTTYGGGSFDLAQQRGKVVVLFFFGCT
jgi:peroxiredoxin